MNKKRECDHIFEELPGPEEEPFRVCIKCKAGQYWDGYNWISVECQDMTLYYKMDKFSTLLMYIGAPLVAIFVESMVGWIFYVIASILTLIFAWKGRDKQLFLKFLNFIFWNVIAIIQRV